MSYKVEVIADSSGTWCSNDLLFATEDEAKEYGKGLFMRWTSVREWRVTKDTRPATHQLCESSDWRQSREVRALNKHEA